nr:unnamed protein product [Callosobruchus chinensis]
MLTHLGAAAPTTLSILDAVQRRAIRLIGETALTCHLQPLSHRRAVDGLSLFYRYTNGFCSSELTSIISPFSKPASGTSSSHPKAVVLHTSRTERYDRTFIPGCPGPGMDCLVMYLLSRRLLAYSSLASTIFLQPNLPSAGAVLWYLGPAFAICSVIKKISLGGPDQEYLKWSRRGGIKIGIGGGPQFRPKNHI